MKHTAFIRFLLIAVLCAIGLMPLTAKLALAHSARTSVEKAASSNMVTILVLDMSGSMGTNDPLGLRCSAANAFIDLSGPNNFIGVVGLDNDNNTRGGDHNFQQAQVWAQPTEMATLAERQHLQSVIATQSHNCRPDNTTPTYDALNQASQMLTSATNNGQIPGSVVLLTDGTPDPDTISQMNAIQADLIPQFKHNGWPIDTVALGVDGPVPGTNTTFHKFLSGLSDATNGKFYDDGHGVVPGVSPLNIADFFVDIFARHNHRIVQNAITPTSLDGSTIRRNFAVTDYTNNLDVVVVKDQAATKATLLTPSGQAISQSGGGVFVSSSDQHYEIFSINQPQAGEWELDVTGSGQFLMDSLKLSGISMSSIAVSQANLAIGSSAAVSLGQSLVVSANLTNNGQTITDNQFTLTGTITYSGALAPFSQSFALDDKNSSGTYVGSITVPDSAAPGSYEIVINASTVSLQSVVASQSRVVRVERFPVPLLVSPQTKQPTTDVVNTGVIQWDPVVRTVYALSFWPVPQLSQWALNNTPAQPSADIAGEVQLQQQPYSAATVTATASSVTSHTEVPVTVVNDGGGYFHVIFSTSANGRYIVTFKTSGTFADSHGDFGTTQQSVELTIVPATFSQEGHAWAFTVLYLLLLIFLYLLVRYMVLPHPAGKWEQYTDGEPMDGRPFKRASRGPWQAFIHPNLLFSRQAKMPHGLQFRFRRGAIEVRAEGREGRSWQRIDGSTIPQVFSGVDQLRYQTDNDDDEPVEYLINLDEGKKGEENESTAQTYGQYDDYGTTAREKKQRRGHRRPISSDEDSLF